MSGLAIRRSRTPGLALRAVSVCSVRLHQNKGSSHGVPFRTSMPFRTLRMTRASGPRSFGKSRYPVAGGNHQDSRSTRRFNTMCFPDLYVPLLRADIRFSAFLPSRISFCAKEAGNFFETTSPLEYCRLLHCPEGEPLAAGLKETLRFVMEEAAHGLLTGASAGKALY